MRRVLTAAEKADAAHLSLDRQVVRTRSSPLPLPSPSGRDFAEMKFRTLNPRTAANSVRSDLFIARAKQRERISLSSSGGEGWGEEAVFSYPRGSWGGQGERWAGRKDVAAKKHKDRRCFFPCCLAGPACSH